MVVKRESNITRRGVAVRREVEDLAVDGAIQPIVEALDSHLGVVLASSYEVPGRYTRWDIGFVDPPLVLVSRGRDFRFTALNERGRVLLPAIEEALRGYEPLEAVERRADEVVGAVRPAGERVPEELRSRQPSIFSVLRRMIELFGVPGDPLFGLYGAFAYDLAFQFEPIRLRLERPADQRDLVLYLPDEIVAVDHRRERATRTRYELTVGDRSTDGLPRDGATRPYVGAHSAPPNEYAPGEYAALVRVARESFKRGDLFEVVPGQTFYEPCPVAPTELFQRLRERNPAPYGFLMNLGEAEYLVGASPEMYVRVEGNRIETCPISGTIPRGSDPIADAAQIARLLASAKDESELTMCTDVDRNDKSRICVPGSVRVIGRRQIEMYSRLIHTVDHVEGRLRDGFDGLDAFLAHTWAVTVTGAPKAWAMQFIEDHERSPRAWYGAAVGLIGFDGGMNTGLTLRTIRIKDGVAQVRAGATLLYDSDPDEEERETHVKASALIDAIRRPRGVPTTAPAAINPVPGGGLKVLLVDHQDSFVHTLANYLRQTGAEVVTLRAGFPHTELDAYAPDLVVLSPGPGTPSDFDLSGTLSALLERRLPVFGVCLGLQGMVEHFGGKLGVLDYPMHGKASKVRVLGGRIFEGLPREFHAGRYHSLYALRDALPASLKVTAETEDGVVMAIEHAELPMAAVQFHPESILSQDDDVGLRLVRNAVAELRRGARGEAVKR
ncbi:anthranilate synthase [Sorangium cellulosum]|uniref:Anthranilate synthase n=1 Tax=Sorangium cellulosum TaxID=56 RepID=A0A150RUL0_SORCE|nr:anthranilate synthase [Sorangium cellulosum]KYF86016.1 anthranilate synthase [Sorangium cellulosum]